MEVNLGTFKTESKSTCAFHSRGDKESFLEEEVPELNLGEGITVNEEEKLGTEAVANPAAPQWELHTLCST